MPKFYEYMKKKKIPIFSGRDFERTYPNEPELWKFKAFEKAVSKYNSEVKINFLLFTLLMLISKKSNKVLKFIYVLI